MGEFYRLQTVRRLDDIVIVFARVDEHAAHAFAIIYYQDFSHANLDNEATAPCLHEGEALTIKIANAKLSNGVRNFRASHTSDNASGNDSEDTTIPPEN